MKTRSFFLLSLVWSFVVVDAAGQGRFVFNNSSVTAITNLTTFQRAGTNTKVAMYYNLNTNVTGTYEPGWVLNPNAVTNLAVPGLFFGGVRTVPGTPGGTTIAVCVRAWSPPYPTWEAQEANWNCDPQPRGESRVFLLKLATSSEPAIPIVGAGLNPINIAPHLGTPICAPLLTLRRDSNTVVLHIKANGSSGGYFRIESNPTLATNGWQVRTNFPAQPNVIWVDPWGAGQPLFYRVRNSWYSF